MKHVKILLVILIGTFALASCNAPEQQAPSEHGGGHMQSSNETDMSIHDQSSDTAVAFTVMEGDSIFTDYGISHTKEMHLIVVRDDLRHFSHLHPSRDSEGTWTVDFSPPAGGTYWMYADFVDSKGNAHTIRFDRKDDRDLGEYGIVKNTIDTVTSGSYTFFLDEPLSSADGLQFNYWIYDALGADASLETYLGEKGHSVLISPSGDFVHTHPFKEYVGYSEDDQPVFVTPHLKDPFYRIFTQFQIDGEVHTVSFDL